MVIPPQKTISENMHFKNAFTLLKNKQKCQKCQKLNLQEIFVVDIRSIQNHVSAIYKRISIYHEAFKPYVSFVSAAFS